MEIYHNLIPVAMQSADPADVVEDVAVSEPGNWLTSFRIGDTAGIDWLLLVGGMIVLTVIGYAVYSMMLYRWVTNNYHPANWRKFVAATVLLASIIWFIFVFRYVFGGLVMLPMLVIWLMLAAIFFISRRKITLSRD